MKATEQHESLEELINQTQKSDKFLAFRKAEENPVQWLHWLNILDQQTSDQGLSSSKLDFGLNSKGIKQEETKNLDLKSGKGSPSKDTLDSSIKGGNMFGRGLQSSGDNYPSLKLPEAMVAFAKEFPGWPLMSNKMQMHKCEKCSQEFCSPLNQRRHMRATHRKPLHGDKEDLKKKRDQIAAFWDKLNPEEACEILLVKNLSLMDLSGASVVKALTTQLQQPSLLLLPQSYSKVATTLLDMVQNRPLKFPLKSEELFGILDDASEKNVLYGVTSSSMQRCIFDSEPGKVGLETKNLVASLGFLVEYRLVRAWMDDKDAEALRCQKALVEEEEAAQKKRAKLQERKRQRKLRIKEFKDKERKSIDSLSCLQELKFGINSGEGEDCLMAIQSSPSSSGYSGPDTNLETSRVPDCGNNRKLPTIGQFSRESDDLESGLGYFSHVSSQHTEPQADFLNQEGEEAARSGGRASQTVVSGGFGWKERRQGDLMQGTGYGKQLYGKDRKNIDHQYGVSRSSRTPYYSLGGSAFEYPRSSTPRYSHNREKLSAFRRPNTVAGAVWARKMPVCQQYDEHDKFNPGEVVDPLSDSKMDRQSTGCLEVDAVTKPCGLSRVSSVSLDSVASHSSGSISARVGAEEQGSMMLDAHVRAAVQGVSSVGSKALVIGSFTIPLEEGLSDVTSGKPAATSEIGCSGRARSPAAEQRTADPCSNDVSVTQIGMTCHMSAGTEDTTMQFKSHGLSLQKSGVKVWRPVTPGGGDRNMPSCSSSPDAVCMQQKQEAGRSCSPRQAHPQSSAGGMSISTTNEDLTEGTTCHAPDNSTAAGGKADFHPAGVAGTDCSTISYYSSIANFLHQRWAKAVSSLDVTSYSDVEDPE